LISAGRGRTGAASRRPSRAAGPTPGSPRTGRLLRPWPRGGASSRTGAARPAPSRAAQASRTPPPPTNFRDKTGLLTALATEGWTLLADALEGEEDFAELGVGYVLFATGHPAHFAVMRAPGLVRGDDADLVAAQQRAGDRLRDGAGADPATALAGWSMVHGLSTLLVDGMVAPEPGSDVESLARTVTGRLGRP
jgi:Tetracyclin repressor-like, C-terminal domain